MSEIDDLLAEEGAAAESYEMPEQLPGHVRVSRPNLGRSTVVSVRLSVEEHGQLQRAAEQANLPVSTLIRIWAVDRLHAEPQGTGGHVAEPPAPPGRAGVHPRTTEGRAGGGASAGMAPGGRMYGSAGCRTGGGGGGHSRFRELTEQYAAHARAPTLAGETRGQGIAI